MSEKLENKIVKFPKKKPNDAKKINDQKFGKEVMEPGFTMLPAILLRGQQRLGLSATKLAVLIQLMDYWWFKDNPPRPAQQTLALRLGMSVRQLQRHLKELETAGFLEMERRHHPGVGGNNPNVYHLDGLVQKLKKLAPEFNEQRESARKNRRWVEKPKKKRIGSKNA